MQDVKISGRLRRRSARAAGVAAVFVIVAAACSEDRDPTTAVPAPAPVEATTSPTVPPTTAAPTTAASTSPPTATGDDTASATSEELATAGAATDDSVANPTSGDTMADTAGAAATDDVTAEAAAAETAAGPIAADTVTETITADTTADTVTDTVTADTVTAETAAPEPTGPTFGNMPWPCGPAESPNTDDGSEPGVTAEQIVIGTGDDAGFDVVPGLNHEATDAIVAMVARCNELGGINGRTIVANYYDSKMLEVNAAALRACGDGVFFLVGTAWAFDEQMEEIRQGCNGGLPSVPTYTVSGVSAHAPMMYQGNPNPADEQPAGGFLLLAEQFPDEVQSVGALSINIGAATSTRDKAIHVSDAFGWNWVSTDLTADPLGENDWTPFANQLQDSGVEVVYFAGQCFPMLGLFAQTAAANGYEPIIYGPPNLYEPLCAEEYPGGALDNVYFDTAFVPMEEAEFNKATQDYLDVVEASGGDTALLGMQATSSFLLWAQAADACGETLTRACVLANLADTHEWTAGGLHAPSDPGGNHPATCTALFKFSGATIERVAPAAPATCELGREGSPPYLQPVDLPSLDALQLDENRISRVYTRDDE